MYDLAELEIKIKSMLSPKRFAHSLGVRDTAVALAKVHGVDTEKAEVAGLLHDCAKEFPIDRFIPLCSQYNVPIDEMHRKETKLIHAPLGAAICERDFGIKDESILEAITYHTLAKPNMTDLSKVLYLADFIEPGRSYFDGLDDLRHMCFHADLDTALMYALDLSLHMVVDEGKRIHYFTVDARNFLIDQKKAAETAKKE